jgi:trk system potassium uptake protein TrkA
MNIIVVGCGRVGAEVAYGLFCKGHKVTVVDQDAGAFRNLPEDFRGLTLRGDVLTQDILLRAGIEHADALAAVTPSDSVNTVLGHIARVVFNVPNVVVRNFDPRKRSLHGAFGLQVISPVSMGAQRIEEILCGDPLHSVCPAGDGTVEIYQMTVPKAWHGTLLRELVPQEQCRFVALTRGGCSALPKLDAPVESGDLLHVSATREAAQVLRERLEKLRKD